MSVFKMIVESYNNALKSNFLAVNSCTGFIIAGAGDILCQKLMPIPSIPSSSSSSSLPVSSSSSSLPASSPPYSASSYRESLAKDNKIIKANIKKVNSSNCRKEVEVTISDHDSVRIDWKRTFDMGLIRAAVITPFIYFWYPFVARTSPGKNIINIIGRIIVDQLLGSPTVILLVFTARAILNNNNLESLINKIRYQMFPTWIAGICYWPFAHAITFGIMPLKHQALWAHFASLYWNMVLSYHSSITPTIKPQQ